jgi:predicted transposase YbfD/YdcC
MLSHFETIPDPRQKGKIMYNFVETIAMAVCAVICSCNSWETIVDFCIANESFFIDKLGLALKNGIPSHDTFQRVFQIMDPKEFEKSFKSWAKSIAKFSQGDLVSIDGKAVRGSASENNRAIILVSAWASKAQLVLAQEKVSGKSNEISAIPDLLKALDLNGLTVTIDAMGCQEKIVKQIVNRGANYVICLKGNQKGLLEGAKALFANALENPEAFGDMLCKDTFDKGHGRNERRFYAISTDIARLPNKDKWDNLKAIGIVRSAVEKKGIETEEIRYFITSLSDVDSFSKAVRGHWGIENGLHWCLDIAFDEDCSRTRKENSAENLAVVRHIAVNILKNFPTPKYMGIERKRMNCAFNADFRDEVMAYAFS